MKTIKNTNLAELSLDEHQVYKQALHIAGVGLWKWNEPGDRMIYISEGAAAIFGMTVDEFLHPPMTISTYMDMVHPDDRKRLNQEISNFYQAFQGEKTSIRPLDLEYRIIRPDGDVRYIHEQAGVANNLSGDLMRSVGAIRDITERKLLEIELEQTHNQFEELIESRTRELKESEDRFRHAARSANLCHWRESAGEKHWTDTSDNTEEMLGVDPELLFGDMSKYAAYIHPDDRDRVLVHYETNLDDKLPYKLEYRWRHPDGAIHHFWEMAEPVLDDQGNLVEWRGTTQDVTPLKRAEEAAQKARREAEIASRAKSEMLATMSHELRTPLNAIIGFSQMLIGQTFGPLGNEKYAEYASDIFNSSTHLLELIDDILDVSAIESGELEPVFTEVDLSRQMRNMVRLAQPRATRGKLTINNNIPPDMPRMLADERRINQIFLNLLSNAVKFTEPGGSIDINAGIESSGNLKISITDSGIGMSSAGIERAKKPFAQVNRGAGGRHEGTGLGLYLTTGLIRLHDGTLDIESTLGEGTTITIRFPAERVL